jgi:hypothetical protein
MNGEDRAKIQNIVRRLRAILDELRELEKTSQDNEWNSLWGGARHRDVIHNQEENSRALSTACLKEQHPE